MHISIDTADTKERAAGEAMGVTDRVTGKPILVAHRSILMIMLVGWLGGCETGPGSEDASEISDGETSDGETLIECMGADYPASAVLGGEVFGVEVDGAEALAELDGIRCVAGGGLTIGGVTDLSPLAALERVEGGLVVLANPGLPNLDGLSSLTHVGGSLVVDANPDLEDIGALVGLVSIAGALKIGTAGNPVGDGATAEHGNDSLLMLPSFTALEQVEVIVVADNDALTLLATPPAAAVRFVGFLNNPALPATDASAWAQMLAGAPEVSICGCLDDPNPVCMAIPPAGS